MGYKTPQEQAFPPIPRPEGKSHMGPCNLCNWEVGNQHAPTCPYWTQEKNLVVISMAYCTWCGKRKDPLDFSAFCCSRCRRKYYGVEG